MKTVERYIFRRAFAMFLSTLVAVSMIVWITQALTRVNVISDSAGSVVAFLTIASLTLPKSILEVVPFAVAIGLAQTFATMNTDSELAVINASGAGRMTVIKPALALAAIASLTVFALDTTLAPASWRTMRQVISDARGDLLTSVIQEGGFSRIEKNLFVQVAERKSGGRLSGIFVADQRDPKLDLAYYAKEGTVVKKDGQSILVMSDGEVHRGAPGGSVSVVRFSAYAFDLDSLKSDSGGGIVLFPKDQTLSYVLNPPSDDPIFKRRPGLFRSDANRRLTSWLIPIVFSLLVVGVAANPVSHRQARIPPLLTVLALALLLRWGILVVENRATGSVVFAWGQILLPVLALMIAVVLISTNRRMKSSFHFTETAIEALKRLVARYPALRSRLPKALNGDATP